MSHPDHLSDLPNELKAIIASSLRNTSNISILCNTNKLFHKQCSQASFWNYYFSQSKGVAYAQELLHKLLVELAAIGDNRLLQVIWNTPLYVEKTKLMVWL